mmetsp:Transcript_37512/g.107671  ORF Transcript_37512/g.107671 Transcript_37512/m.107671 type:complete len:212 (-) Transcript_37512:439-1074(-)
MHERLDQRRRPRRNTDRHLQIRPGDVIEQHLAVGRVEGRHACEHVEQEHTEVVDVDGVPVRAPQQNLRREKGNGPAEGCRVVAVDALFGEPEVRQHGMPGLVEHDVVRLQVPEDDLALVQVAEGEQQLRGVELGEGLLQAPLSADQLLQIPIRAVLQHQDQERRGLEGVVQGHDVGVADVGEDVALSLRIPLEILRADLALLERLHCICLS